MLSTRDILLTVLLPGVFSLGVMLLAWRPWRRRDDPARGPFWAAPLAIGGAFLIALPSITGQAPAFPPRQFTDALFWVGGAITIVAILNAVIIPVRAQPIVALITLLLATAAAFALQLSRHTWTTPHWSLIVISVGLAGFLWWASLETLARRGAV